MLFLQFLVIQYYIFISMKTARNLNQIENIFLFLVPICSYKKPNLIHFKN